MAGRLVYNVLRETPAMAWKVAGGIPILSRLISSHTSHRDFPHFLSAAAGTAFMVLRTNQGQRACSVEDSSGLLQVLVAVATDLLDGSSKKALDDESLTALEYVITSLWGAVR